MKSASVKHNNYCHSISFVIRQVFFLPKQCQNLDLSYKMDLDLWDCLGKVKLISEQSFI